MHPRNKILKDSLVISTIGYYTKTNRHSEAQLNSTRVNLVPSEDRRCMPSHNIFKGVDHLSPSDTSAES